MLNQPIVLDLRYQVNTAGPEKESSQNLAGSASEGKAPFENLYVR
jgi:hypothetical protein